MIAAMLKLARNQVLIEARLNAQDEQIVDHRQRLEAIESQLGAGHTITPDQATSISQAVKAVARELSQRTGRILIGQCPSSQITDRKRCSLVLAV